MFGICATKNKKKESWSTSIYAIEHAKRRVRSSGLANDFVHNELYSHRVLAGVLDMST
jgi:hypothetical protein